jgi:hypothetical protein
VTRRRRRRRRRKRRRRRRSRRRIRRPEGPLRNYWTDTIVRPKQVLHWCNFVTRRGRRSID